MRVIAVAMEKGGSHKTTVAHAISYGLHNRGCAVLMVDCDPQSSLSMLCGVKVGSISVSLMDVLAGSIPIQKAIQPVKLGLDIIPSGMKLSMADYQLSGTIARESLLKTALQTVQGNYDFCVLDLAPSFGLVTMNALTAADHVVIPATVDLLSLQALAWLFQYIGGIQSKVNPELKVNGILLTAYETRNKLTKALEPQFIDAATRMNTKVFATRIRKSEIIRKSQATLTDVFTAGGRAAEDYTAFMNELLNDILQRGKEDERE